MWSCPSKISTAGRLCAKAKILPSFDDYIREKLVGLPFLSKTIWNADHWMSHLDWSIQMTEINLGRNHVI